MKTKLIFCVLAVFIGAIGLMGCAKNDPAPTPAPTPTPAAAPQNDPTLDALYQTDKAAYYNEAVNRVAENTHCQVKTCAYAEDGLRVELRAKKARTQKEQLDNAKITITRLLALISAKLDVPLSVEITVTEGKVEPVVVSAIFEPDMVKNVAFFDEVAPSVQLDASEWVERTEPES